VVVRVGGKGVGGCRVIDRRPWAINFGIYALAVVFVLLAIGPAVWLLLISLQPAGTDLKSISPNMTLKNFQEAWEKGGLATPLLNSVLVTSVRAGLNVLIAALAAYPLARMTFRGRNTIFTLLLCTMMIPDQVIVVPMFTIIAKLGLYDTLIAVVLPFAVSAFGIFLCRNAFAAIPWEMEEAARIDGASAFQTWWNVMIPLAAPTLATLALFSIIGAWSDLLWPLIVLQDHGKFTLPVAVNNLMGQFSTNARLAYAGSVLALIPIIAVFIACQRFLKAELFAGSVKG
jgi:putative chitobiose transport system permease protein